MKILGGMLPEHWGGYIPSRFAPTCLPLQDGGIPLSAFTNGTSKLASLLVQCKASCREAVNTKFKVIEFDQTWNQTQVYSFRGGALRPTTQPSELLFDVGIAVPRLLMATCTRHHQSHAASPTKALISTRRWAVDQRRNRTL